MTNKEIDEICGRFAGLEPAPGCYCSVSHETGERICKAPRVMGFQTTCLKDNVKWPPVSSTGDAMLLLMDALPDHVEAQIFRRQKNRYVCKIYDLESDKDGWDAKAVADSAPMALALAVCELAKAKEQGV